MKTILVLAISGVCGVGMIGCDKKNEEPKTSSSTTSERTTTVDQTNADRAVTDQTGVRSSDVTVNTTVAKPDNTAVNVRDRTADAITAGAQSQASGDIERTAAIRKLIVAGKMSTLAQNVKVVTQSGKVTLRGPVNTQAEKDSIGKMATDVAGVGNVDNQLEVKAQ